MQKPIHQKLRPPAITTHTCIPTQNITLGGFFSLSIIIDNLSILSIIIDNVFDTSVYSRNIINEEE